MEKNRFVLLLVDDEPDIISSIRRVFRNKEYEILTAYNGGDALQIVKDRCVDAAIIDLLMPGIHGIELLTAIKKENSSIEVVILTAFGLVDEAVKAMKLGAADFFEKPVRNEKLLSMIEHIEMICRLKKENTELKEQMDFSFGFERLIGNSTSIVKLKMAIKQIASVDASVLILGETGTGKELIAQALHQNSRRNSYPCVVVDCASFGESVLESELFGHVKGAFTGALNATEGLLRAAQGGTVFFDEIGELPLHMQSKLLRVAQEREVRPVGGTRTYQVDVRILAATNRDLKREVEEGRFREDLYYRLNVISLIAPPLRDREEDIIKLAYFFLEKYRPTNTTPTTLPEAVLTRFREHNWPGNVRELENVIKRALALSREGTIDPSLFVFDDANKAAGFSGTGKNCGTAPITNDVRDPATSGRSAIPGGSKTLLEYEVQLIRDALAANDGCKKAAAQDLGIAESTLHRKLKKIAHGVVI